MTLSDKVIEVLKSVSETDEVQRNLDLPLVTARANRPFLKAQRSNVLSGVENVTVQTAGFQPTLSANLGLEQKSSSTSDNPLDPDKPSTHKAKQISITPPAGKVETSSD